VLKYHNSGLRWYNGDKIEALYACHSFVIFLKFDALSILQSDNGKEFQVSVFEEFKKMTRLETRS
jgi:hypothetical protein